LRYQGNFAAGKNKIINGDFGIWQRGTTFTNPTPTAYTADRWQIEYDGTGATRTVSQQTFTPGAAPVAGYEGQYFYRYAVTAIGTGNTYQDFRYNQEDVRTLAGQTATISFWAKADASRVLNLLYRTVYGTGGSSANQFSAGSVTLTTSWVRYSITYAVPSVSGLTIGAGSYSAWIFRPIAATAQTIDIWGVQVEAGSVATAFQTSTGTIQGELAACQRYYYRNTPGTTYGIQVPSIVIYNTTTALVGITPPVPMRVTPTSGDWSGLQIYDSGNSTYTISALSFTNVNNGPNQIAVEVTATGLTAGRPALIRNNNNSAGYLGFSAEL
jgi:hypothetical protein